jgi:malonyl-CoA/methylmalonyl-CoA synthetase
LSSIFETLSAHCDQNPGATLLVDSASKTWTREEFRALALKLTAALCAAGVTPGDRVAAIVEKSPQALALYLACQAGGFVFFPINPGYTDPELGYLLADAEPSLIVCDPTREDGMSRLAAGPVLTLDAHGSGSLMLAAAEVSPRHAVAAQGSDWAALLYTSGTTGRPKGAIITHGNLSSNAHTLMEAWRFSANDRLLHMLPIFHAHGLFVAANTVFVSGASLLFEPTFTAERFFARLPHATVFMGVPTHYGRMLQDGRLSASQAGRVRLFVSGSAPLDRTAHMEFEARTGQRILERYGMTETVMLTSNPYEGERRAGSVGPALPGVGVRVRNQDGDLAGPEEVGIVEVTGPNVFSGYFKAPEKTAASFTEDGWFITGDIGRLAPDGYLTLEGRQSDTIISGGYNVYPREVEDAVCTYPGITEACVFGAPHPDFGESVVAVVVAAPETSLEPSDVIRACRGQLAAYKTPKAVVRIDALPRNAMGKVDRKGLRELYADLFAKKT